MYVAIISKGRIVIMDNLFLIWGTART